ncbi:MAG: S-layer homology domain-containing protein [Oscillospiraceae bacterium]|nr:S-layer homology domain-containing protein [Oscillospiraceae bacterium]
MKTFLRRLLVLTLAMLMLTQGTLAAFTQVNDPIEFSDVPYDHWAHYEIGTMYQHGLMLGTGGDQFSPSGTVSVAQAVTVTMRVWELARDGDGVLDQSGEHWYDGAVEAALSNGLIERGQFDSYDRTATRAELAGLLAHALPAGEYKAINNITEIPDVDGATPYSEEIYTLYNAGILAGSDGYGTFYPERDITRAELSAILYRMIYSWNRKEFTLLPKPADLTVYSSSKCLYIDGIPVYGLTRIDGKYYVPAVLLSSERMSPVGDLMSCYSDDQRDFSVSFNSRSYGEIAMLDYAAVPPEGKVMGTADANPGSVRVNYDETMQGAVYTIGGRYPMISLDVLGAVEQGGSFYLDACEEENHTPSYEADLVGRATPQLARSADRETVIAIHDYLVSTLTYDILTSAPYGTTEEEYAAAEALWQAAYEEYALSTNRALHTKYAICQDYAELFQSMCIRLGIPCDMVSGEAGGPHAWNIVYVDGEWLYMDCTWDDPVSKKPVLDHDYCLIGPDVLVKDHYWDGDDYPMPDEYDPAWEQLDPNNITSADMFRKCLIAQLVIANRNDPQAATKTVKLRVTKSGAYGGTGVLYADYEGAWWWSMRGGYDSASGMYVYTFGDMMGW